MRNSCRQKSSKKEKHRKNNDEKEERAPKIVINLLKGTTKIINSSEKVENNASAKENLANDSGRLQRVENAVPASLGSFTIADKVKLRKRGQNTLSGGRMFQSCLESSLPERKRRKRRASNCSSLSSSSATMSSSDCDKTPRPSFSPMPLTDSSSYKFSPSSATMSSSDCDKTPRPSFSPMPLTDSSSYKSSPSSATMSSSDCDKTPRPSFSPMPLTDSSSYNIPVKKAKLDENWNESQLNEPSTSVYFLDELQHEVALYEEVCTEPTATSPFTSQHESKDNSEDIPELCNSPEELVHCSANAEEKSLFIVENEAIEKLLEELVLCSANVEEKPSFFLENDVIEKLLEELVHSSANAEEKSSFISVYDVNEELRIAEIYESIRTACMTFNPHENPVFHPAMQDFAVNLEKARRKLSMSKESTDAIIRAMVNLCYQIMEHPYSEENSTRENGSMSLDRMPLVLSSLNQYTKPIENSTSVEKKIESTSSIEHFTTSTSGSSFCPKTRFRVNRNNKDNNGVFKQENCASKEKRKAMDDRCIVYVGNMPFGYSEFLLKERFRRFGAIKDIQIKSKVRCDYSSFGGHPLDSEETRNYGFITFSTNQEATDAIERGNDEHMLKFQLSFGARRQFVGEEYKDLDGIVAKNENSLYKHNSRSSLFSQNKEDDYAVVLKGYIQERGVKPHPFSRMQCHA